MTQSNNLNEIVLQCIAVVFKKDITTISSETRLIEDLDAKSVNIVQLLALLEHRTDVQISLAKAKGLKTVADLVALINSLQKK